MKRGARPALRIVVLAAGFSKRLGRPKALARVHGLSLLHRTLRVLAPFRASSRIIVVVPRRAQSYRGQQSPRDTEFVANRHRGAGLGSSVRTGIARARHSSAVLLLPVDLAELTGRDLKRLIARWHGARRHVVARRIAGRPGIPLILPRRLYGAVSALTGDQGLREIVGRVPRRWVSLLEMHSATADVDTPQDLARARRRRLSRL